MQQAALQGQAQQTRKSPAVVAGLGAAFIASAITLTMMMSNPSPAVSDQAAVSAAAPQCKLINREYLVATTSGSGTVRLREGNYLSPPITLSTQPQLVTFPLLRPQAQPVSEVITVEGRAADVVLTSRVTGWKRVFESVDGVVAFQANWAPLKSC